ncbi:hypothetical protein O6H91_07G014600 [Diphasiastrum complanatum]|uniref:Uncharacterized protein n=2 Tax=Diphasiastrum complanatum TaxID=34168 RepID=A0ACC2D2M4_DIPCM|nr:hypothetical protein O6H91_07G014600 [Diphasiastrum complanatum]KAJ7548502.1 hypothetical protein O6H91_07G014600 [Diphasiastrum complanatum]
MPPQPQYLSDDCSDGVEVPDSNVAKELYSPVGSSPGKRQVSQSTAQEHMQQNQHSKQPRTEKQLQQHTDGSPVASPSVSPQSIEVKKVSCEDIQMVQNLIERCLQLYMNQKEVINTLLNQAKVEPGFTSLVWQKLEEQNMEFFRAYYTRLKLKRQIIIFNQLLEQHFQLLQKVYLPRTKPTVSVHNSKHVSAGYGPGPEPFLTVPRTSTASVDEAYLQEGFQSPNSTSGANSTANTSPAISPTISSCAAFPFGVVESPSDLSSANICLRTSVPLEAPYNSSEAQNQGGMIDLPIGTTDAHSSSTREVLGSLGQLPRNFSLSDLTPELGNTSD